MKQAAAVKSAVRFAVADVDGMLKRWREGVGKDWKQQFRQRIESHRGNYVEQRNPIDVWQGLLLARGLGEPAPNWIMDALACDACAIYNLMEKSMQGDTPTPARIARALGLTADGAGTLFPGIKEWDWAARAGRVQALLDDGQKETYAIDEVARAEGVSASKVRGEWKKFKNLVEK